MTNGALSEPPLRNSGLGPLIGVVDIGSNSVRLVVFCGPPRAPTPVFNEKVLCGLGRRLVKTNRLDEQGMELTLLTMRRFAGLAERMGVRDLQVVATAAAREAENGPAFIAEIERQCGVKVRILSGAEEARYSALGVLSGMPEAEGVIGDIGGGSLELVRIENSKIVDTVTLPLGPFRISAIAPDDLKKHVDGIFDGVPWLKAVRGRSLYLVGGAWRSIARIHMAQTNYPLRIIHAYRMTPREGDELTRLLSRQSRESLLRVEGLSRRRSENLPSAAFVLRRLIKRLEPRDMIFSALGLREGLHYASLSDAERAADPLIAACRDMAAREGRFAPHGDELAAFLQPLFVGETPEEARLRLAAAHLSDVAWRVNPDYRGEQAFRRVLRAPFVGIDHPGRAFIALSVFARYTGEPGNEQTLTGLELVDPAAARRAYSLGLGLRLAMTFSAGTPEVVRELKLKVSERTLTLTLEVPAQVEPLVGEVTARRLDDLAKSLGLAADLRVARKK